MTFLDASRHGQRRAVLLEHRGEAHHVVRPPVEPLETLVDKRGHHLVAQPREEVEVLVHGRAQALQRLSELLDVLGGGRELIERLSREQPLPHQVGTGGDAQQVVDVPPHPCRELEVEVVGRDLDVPLLEQCLEQPQLDRRPPTGAEGHIDQADAQVLRGAADRAIGRGAGRRAAGGGLFQDGQSSRGHDLYSQVRERRG